MSIKIRIVSDFDKKGLTAAEKGLNSLSKSAGLALAAVGAAVVGIAAKSVQEFAKFDGALTQSKAIMGDLTQVMEKDMADAAREVAKATTFSAEQAAESFFFLASAGLDAEASIAALPQVAQFAQAGMFDMAQATDLLTDAQSALGLSSKNAETNLKNMAQVSDVLVRANTLANASVEQFSTALTTKAGAALRALGKDVEEGVAVLAAFADQGIKGEIAGTQLSIVLRDLTTKAIKNKDAFDDMGIAVFDSNGEMNNLGDIIGNLETALAGMSDETQKATLLQLGFSDKSLASLQALLGTSEAIKTYETELRSASGFTKDVAGKQLETFSSQLKLLESAFIDVAIQIGEELTPYLEELIPVIQDLLPIIGEKLAAAFKQIDWAGIIDDVSTFFVTLVENLDTITRVATAIGIMAIGLTTYTTGVKLANIATGIFNSTLRLNPFVLLATGIVLATIALQNFHVEQKRNREEATKLSGRQAEITAELNRLKELVDAGIISWSQYRGEVDPLIVELSTLQGQFGATSGEANRFNNLSLAGVRNEIVSTSISMGDFVNSATAARNTLASFKGYGAFFENNAKTVTIPTGPSDKELAFEKVRKLIKDSQKQLASAQKSYNKSVQQANEDYADSVVNLQADFANRLEAVIQQSQDRLRSAYKSAVEVNLATLFDQEGDASVEGLVASLSDKLKGSRSLLANSAALASNGFSQTFIEQVVSAGVETGNELASAILESTPEVQDELKSLFSAIEMESNQGMDALAEQIYNKQGLATDALKSLYEQTQNDLADALIEQQNVLAENLIGINETYMEAVQAIRDNVTSMVEEMGDQLGGLGGTIDQFLAKLDELIAKQKELAAGGSFGTNVTTFPTPGGGTGSLTINPLPMPTSSPSTIASYPTRPLQQNFTFNVKTDATQSPAMVGSTLGAAVGKYTSTGGAIKGLTIVGV
jgi:TP901 family phage tail tape measure protein